MTWLKTTFSTPQYNIHHKISSARDDHFKKSFVFHDPFAEVTDDFPATMNKYMDYVPLARVIHPEFKFSD